MNSMRLRLNSMSQFPDLTDDKGNLNSPRFTQTERVNKAKEISSDVCNKSQLKLSDFGFTRGIYEDRIPQNKTFTQPSQMKDIGKIVKNDRDMKPPMNDKKDMKRMSYKNRQRMNSKDRKLANAQNLQDRFAKSDNHQHSPHSRT